MNSTTPQEQSRKRAAPGAWPQNPPTNLQQTSTSRIRTIPDASQMSDDQFLSWGASNDTSNQADSQNYSQFTGPSLFSNPPSQVQQTSNQLVRRLNNAQIGDQQLHRLSENRGSPVAVDDSDEDDGDLEARAQEARREAQSKRPPRQIPPFIQKLSSFLDDPKSHDLIRWADDGKSFVVLDEDRFANELIPEMFKHNNYASFVRQLNMYGFHKKVGLSDNSMRASEKKAKLPSGYRHKYFRRGRSDLLWLIEKPKPGNLSSKKKPSKPDSKEATEQYNDGDEVNTGGHPASGNTDLVTLPRSDLSNIHNLQREVQDLQTQQQHIYHILKSMRDENKQYIKQASAMVANHERHETSINAILQFLATFYNQSLQGGNTGNGMFSNSIPNHQPQSSVVEEMGDYSESPTDFAQFQQQEPRQRRPLALLPAPHIDPEQPRSPRRRTPFVKAESASSNLDEGPISNGSSENPSPKANAQPNAQQQTDPTDNILNAINRSNARQGARPRYDLSALQQYSQNANGSGAPLTPEQRDAVLSIMANKSGATTPGGAATGSDLNANSMGMDPNPYLDYLQNNQEQLDLLERLQREQDSRVQDLAGRLQPLSPNGSIPGLDVSNSQDGDGLLNDDQFPGQFNPQSDGFDFDSYLNDDFLDHQQADDGNYGEDPDLDIDWTKMPGNAQRSADGDSLFGDIPAGEDRELEGTAVGDEGRTAGRIVGSVGTSNSSGAPTPRPPSVQDDNGDADGHQGKRRKRNG